MSKDMGPKIYYSLIVLFFSWVVYRTLSTGETGLRGRSNITFEDEPVLFSLIVLVCFGFVMIFLVGIFEGCFGRKSSKESQVDRDSDNHL
ncbi:hypothetical protein [Marinimicrobium alkaliphilum]|uniref:hypothetical protein n=1 Tax=Marinimicrobium alkaliphilum TaxID=2202654 RepID=UPI000DBA2362|nr:hypothetical protein [Marinimicrobium alkaliphilum]